MAAKYFDKSGAESTKAAWLAQKDTDPTVQYDEVDVGGDRVLIWTRFSGVNHGMDVSKKQYVYELGIDSDNKSNKYHGTHRLFTTAAEALGVHKAILSIVKAGGDV